jgi:hypothetical protein
MEQSVAILSAVYVEHTPNVIAMAILSAVGVEQTPNVIVMAIYR